MGINIIRNKIIMKMMKTLTDHQNFFTGFTPSRSFYIFEKSDGTQGAKLEFKQKIEPIINFLRDTS